MAKYCCQRYLALGLSPGMQFLSQVEIDATSSITLTTSPQDWANIFTSNDWNRTWGMAPHPADLLGGIIRVDSLTPGYQPEIRFGFAPGGDTVNQITIKDVPITAHS
jgi:hypothetical protein